MAGQYRGSPRVDRRDFRPPHRVGRKTGPKPTFTEADVIVAALDIGIGRFTLAEVAKKIGVATSAVYRLFDSRDDLVEACLVYCARRVEWHILPRTTWQEALKQWSQRVWEICDTYQGLDSLIFSMPGVFVPAQHSIARLVDLMVREGYTREDAIIAFDLVSETTVGTHIGDAVKRSTALGGLTAPPSPSSTYVAEEQEALQIEDYLGQGFLEKKVDVIIAAIEQRAQK